MNRVRGTYFVLFPAIVCIAFLFAPHAWAGRQPVSYTYLVPADFPSIQAAIDYAADGDTVLVGPGTYVENIDFLGKLITVRSTDGRGVTTIDGGGGGSVVSFRTGETGESVLEGFTITNGDAFGGGGIYVYGASPAIVDCAVDGNTAELGGGMYVAWESFPAITDCSISNNAASDKGGGMYITRAHPVVTDTLIANNAAVRGGGACIHTNAVPYFVRSTITGNEALMDGGGLHTCWLGVAYLLDSDVRGNVAQNGGGVAVGQQGIVRAENTVVAANGALTGGGLSLYGSDSEGELTNCTVSGNGGAGGGLYAVPASFTMLLNTIVFGNQMVPVVEGTADISYSDVEGGAPGTGNMDGAPAFVNAAAGDYRLTDTSPCIDAGTALFAPEWDRDGYPRPMGEGHDMGAHEYPFDLDGDGDGYIPPEDCDDSDPGVYPGAPEVKHDGRDQDCNGYDLTIDILRAEYHDRSDSLRVEAVSALGEVAVLEVVSRGPMRCRGREDVWVAHERSMGGDPVEVTVCGVEGCERAWTTLK
jgi:hypothetical protein